MSGLDDSSHLSPNKSYFGPVGLRWSVFIWTVLDLRLGDGSETGLEYAWYLLGGLFREGGPCVLGLQLFELMYIVQIR